MSLYDLPDQSQLAAFIGATLIQICVGQYQLILKFSGELTVSLESSLTITTPSAQQSWLPDCKLACAELFSFIGSVITNLTANRDTGLTITFGDTGELQIAARSDSFESFQIQIGTDLFIV